MAKKQASSEVPTLTKIEAVGATSDTNKPNDIDEYIACFSPEVQAILREIQVAIRSEVPEAEENISYRMPAFRLFILIVIVFVARGLGAAETLHDRLSADVDTAGLLAYDRLSPAGRQVASDVESVLVRTGRMPSYLEYADILRACRGLLPMDSLHLHTVMRKAQKQNTSQDDLYKLIRGQRALIHSLRAEYGVVYEIGGIPEGPEKAKPGGLRFSCEFMLSGQMLYFSETRFHGTSFESRTIEAYDGHELRGYREFSGSSGYGSIQALDTRKRFFHDGNPLLCSHLIDQHADLQGDTAFDDLAQILGGFIVFETPTEIAGVSCIVAGSTDVQYYVSPSHSFALVEKHYSELDFDTDRGCYRESDTFYVLKNSDFVSFEGVFLPFETTFSLTQAGRVVEQFKSKVSQLEVNGELPDAIFSEIIPSGTNVSDSIRNKITLSVNPAAPITRAIAPSTSAGRITIPTAISLLAVISLCIALYVRRQGVAKIK